MHYLSAIQTPLTQDESEATNAPFHSNGMPKMEYLARQCLARNGYRDRLTDCSPNSYVSVSLTEGL
jgi:hypothetical protein